MTILYYYYHWILSFTVGLWDFPGLSLETENLITLNTANREFNDMYTSLGGRDVSCRPLRFYWTISYKSTALQLEVSESAWTLSTLLSLPYLLQAYAMYYILSVNNRRPCQNKQCIVKCVDSWTNSNEIVAYYSGMQCQRNWFFSAFYLWLVGTPASPSLLLIGAGRSININNVSLLCSRFKEVSFLASV